MIKNYTFNLINILLRIIPSFLVVVFLGRKISFTDVSDYAILMSFSLIISTIIDGGIYLYTLKNYASKQITDINQFLLQRILFVVPITILFGCVLSYKFHLILAILTLSIASVFNQILRAKMESLTMQQKMILPELFSNIIFTIILVYLYSSVSSYLGLICALILRELLFFIFSRSFLKIKSESSVEEKIQNSRRKKLFHPAFFNSILVSGDLYLLNITMTSHILGQYSLVRNLGQTGSNILTQLLTKSLMPDSIRQVRPNILILIAFLFLGSMFILVGTDYLVFLLWGNTDNSFASMASLIFILFLLKILINFLNIFLLKADNYRAYRVSQTVLPLLILFAILIGAHFRDITIVLNIAIVLNLVHFSTLLVMNRLSNRL